MSPSEYELRPDDGSRHELDEGELTGFRVALCRNRREACSTWYQTRFSTLQFSRFISSGASRRRELDDHAPALQHGRRAPYHPLHTELAALRDAGIHFGLHIGRGLARHLHVKRDNCLRRGGLSSNTLRPSSEGEMAFSWATSASKLASGA